MDDNIKNLYNRPFYYSCILSVTSAVILFTILYFYIADPYTRFENSMFQGAAVFQDVMSIFWGYVVNVAFLICGLTTFNLAYQAKRSDHPKTAGIIKGFSLVTVAVSIIFAFWFTVQVLSAFSAI